MTYLSDLFLNRCRIGYLLEWYFEELHPKALSFQAHLDNEITAHAWHNLADQVNGEYPYRSTILIKPRRYAELRVLRLTIFDGYSHESPRPLSQLSVLNSPRLLPMIERYD